MDDKTSAAEPGQAAYETWRAAVPDFVCNVPVGPWDELSPHVRAGFNAITARTCAADSELAKLARELQAEAEEISPGGRGSMHDIAWADALRSCAARVNRVLREPAAAAPAAPQPTPETIRAAFAGFLASQGYDEQDRFDQDEMELAFETGMFVQAGAPAAPQSAGDGGGYEPFIAASGEHVVQEIVVPPGEPAPELAQLQAGLREAQHASRKRAEILARVLGSFGKPDSWGIRRATSTGHTLDRWAEEAGLPDAGDEDGAS